ncbi:hypothetical protein P280DRAFT_91493 [Massarina eburnea CBS 473.64]|uniref:Rhodopsin domain-containing protein n=1 Tax=Massarina eburnea CBS 473.64 TaxID=1395130 RepID=A0A6A6RSD7_9PLEO|nr:hypothetical protein P280DRAFT_91493 [Massarina eburnea CBS 473.64]
MTPSGLTEAYRNADNGSQSLIGASFALLALTTIFFICFLLSRYYNEAGVSRLMFWLIVAAYIFNAGNAIDNALSAILGDAGKHVSTLSHATNIASGKIGKAADYLYIPSAILPKLAMLAFYHQVFPGRVYHWTIYASAGLLVGTLLAGLLQATLICKPFAAYWDGEGSCGDLMATYRWLSWPNILTDFIMLVMPFPMLLKLQVSRTTKIKLILTFMAGSLGIITAILRIISFYTIPIFTDSTFYLVQPSIYSVVEPSAYLICATMPTLRHLTRRISYTIGLPTISSTRGYSAYDRSRTAHSRSSRLPSAFAKLSAGSSAKTAVERDEGVEADLELGKVGLSPRERRGAWNRTEVGTGTREEVERERGVKDGIGVGIGEIVCKTDIDMISEPRKESWRTEEENRESLGDVDVGDGGEEGEERASRDGSGFGDEVPLKGGTER